jgi:putative hemolysin
VLALVLVVIVDAFVVFARSTIQAFSLADAEEWLRKRDQSQSMLPRIERFAERIKDYSFVFMVIAQLAKAVAAWLIWQELQQLGWNGWLLWSGGLGFFALFVLFSDTLMRPLALINPEAVTVRLLPLWRLTYVLVALPVLPFRVVHHGLTDLISRRSDEDESDQAEDDILAVVAMGEAQGQIGEAERDMIESVLELSDLTVADIMTPRTDMSATPVDASWDEIIAIARESGHSRLPVYEGNRDHIVGLVYVKDLIGYDIADRPALSDLMRDAHLVPASKKVVDLLADLRQERITFAIVLDEYGGTSGIVTIEDIVEHVFGDIEDEYDEVKEVDARQIDSGCFEFDARLKIEEVNDRFDLNLPESQHYESLGGLITSELGYIPEKDEEWRDSDGRYRLKVLECTERRVTRIRLDRLDGEQANEAV